MDNGDDFVTKIDLITGFLGSGKTTFMKLYASHFLSKGENIGILENDYGAVNVDMMLMSDLAGENCTLETVAGACDADCHKRRFKTKLIAMGMSGYDRVIVEPSGIFDVDEFFDTLREEPLDRWYEIGSVITVVDPTFTGSRSETSLSLLASQAASAGVLVFSKTQLASENDIQNAVDTLKSALKAVKCDRDISGIIMTKDWKSLTFDDFEKKIVENNVKLFILCSPHNPIGRVWTREELSRVGSICKKHNVFIVADEIHCDFTWNDHTHTMFLDACPDCHQLAISCTAPSKTFNLAGLQVSNIFIPDGTKRKQLTDEIWAGGYLYLNTIGLAACQAAYESGQDWLKAVKEYIWENILFCIDYTEKNLPGVKIIRPQGTYLVWMDYRGTGLSFKEIEDLINVKARVWLDDGSIFGKEGEGFERINVACPRAVLAEALERIKGVFLKKS